MKKISLFFLLLFLLPMACADSEKRATEKARQLIYTEQNQKAFDHLRQSTQKYPKNLELKYLYGWVLLNRNDLRAALHQFALCLNADKNDYGGHKGFGEIFLFQKNYRKAEEEFRKALKSQPKKPEIYASLSKVKLLQNQRQEAQDFMKQAVQLEKKYGDYDLLMARLSLNLNQPKEALASLALAKKKPFLKKSLRKEIDCIDGGAQLELFEKESKEKPVALKPNDSRLQRARQALDRCNKNSPHSRLYQVHQRKAASFVEKGVKKPAASTKK